MSNEKIISEATPIRIGLVVAFLAVFGGAIYWAGTINAKLDSIISSQTSTTGSIAEIKSSSGVMEKEIGDLTLRVAILESKDPSSKK